MSVITRDLQSMAIARQANQEVLLSFDRDIELPNGSYADADPIVVPYMARVVDLTADQLQRLQSGGITLHTGAVISIPYELEATPDQAYYNGASYKIVEATISENCSHLIIDKAPIGFARVEPTA